MHMLSLLLMPCIFSHFYSDTTDFRATVLTVICPSPLPLIPCAAVAMHYDNFDCSAIKALYPTVWGVLVGLSICNVQEGGADNMKSICESESIGVCSVC